MASALRACSFRLGCSVEDFVKEPLFQPGKPLPADLAGLATSLRAWLPKARSQPPTAAPWDLVFAAAQASGARGWGKSSEVACQLLGALAWAAAAAAKQLLGAGAAGAGSGSGSGDPGDPRERLALQNTFKLALFFMCHILQAAMASAAAAVQAAGGGRGGGRGGGKGGRGTAGAAEAEEASQRLQLCHEALRGLASLEAHVWDSQVLPALADRQAADRLLRGAALGCLLHPQSAGAGDKGSRALADGLRANVIGEGRGPSEGRGPGLPLLMLPGHLMVWASKLVCSGVEWCCTWVPWVGQPAGFLSGIHTRTCRGLAVQGGTPQGLAGCAASIPQGPSCLPVGDWLCVLPPAPCLTQPTRQSDLAQPLVLAEGAPV